MVFFIQQRVGIRESNPFFKVNFTHYGVKMLANTPVLAALFPCTALKFSFKKFIELKTHEKS